MKTVIMLAVQGKERYSGFMKGSKGESLRCNLTPGVHSLPDAKAEQLCRDFPGLFQMGESINPPTPESSESSSQAAPASLTGSFIPKESKRGKGKK